MPPTEDREPDPSYPPGRQPYDMLNGIRIGALVGALLGLVAVGFIGTGGLVAVILLAVAGGVTGYAWERRNGPRG